MKFRYVSCSQISIKSEKIKPKDAPKKTMLERRWSAITSATSLRRKKGDSFIYQPNGNCNSPKGDFVRVSKSEYEEIKNRVSAIEKRLSLELDNMQSTVIHNEVNIIHNVQSAYEQTLEQTKPMSPGTDHLARKLSKELRIRNTSDKVIRSPSARKIGTIRRRSRELERPNKISRNSPTQHVTSSKLGAALPRSVSSPISSKHSENRLKVYAGSILSLNTPRRSLEFNFKAYNPESHGSGEGNSESPRKHRGVKRSISTNHYSPQKIRSPNHINRRSLELVTFNNSNKENNFTSKKPFTPKMPQIKRAIPVGRTPKRLCITPCSSRINTPLRVIPNNFTTPKS